MSFKRFIDLSVSGTHVLIRADLNPPQDDSFVIADSVRALLFRAVEGGFKSEDLGTNYQWKIRVPQHRSLPCSDGVDGGFAGNHLSAVSILDSRFKD